MTVLVTGGAGFIGSNFVLDWVRGKDEPLVNVDKLTYAGHIENLAAIEDDPNYTFIRQDICDGDAVLAILRQYEPRAIVHLAAESHVDRSVQGPAEFVRTNILGTFELLENAHRYWTGLGGAARDQFRFLNVSTDEVFGSLEPDDPAFRETTPYAPNSPYSASKASADHLARAYFHTFGLPVLTSNCSNNYGPYQYPEKLIPLMILNAVAGEPLPVYGDGRNSRDWLYVKDHCAALRLLLERGRPGETYNVGGGNEVANIDLVTSVCRLLDQRRPLASGDPHSSLITFVEDRPGHDLRYAMDFRKIEAELGWRPAQDFDRGLAVTVDWYLRNEAWLREITGGGFRDWIDRNYGTREPSR